MWFEKLTGFREESIKMVQQKIVVEGDILTSKVNGRSFFCGTLDVLNLAELRRQVFNMKNKGETISVREVIANVQDLHCDPLNKNSLFQVASQFNLLEMAAPTVIPERGVDIYEHDHTQGPACAIAAGPGTIFRNYFADVDGQIGQTFDRQIDCLSDIGIALDNTNNRLWEMKNGYALATKTGLAEIAECLEQSSEEEVDRLRQLLRIGVHWNTEVTINDCGHTVSQAYCSVAYSGHSAHLWEPFARLILEASYEATICAAILNYARTGANRVFLTMVGGGVFGNHSDWIIDAIKGALNRYRHVGLDVVIVSYGSSHRSVRELIHQLTAEWSSCNCGHGCVF